MNNSLRYQQMLIQKSIDDRRREEEKNKKSKNVTPLSLDDNLEFMKPTIEEVEKYGELITDYAVDEYEEVDAGFVNVYLYQDKTYSIVEWQPHASKKGKEFIMV